MQAIPNISNFFEKNFGYSDYITWSLAQRFKLELKHKYSDAIASFERTGGKDENEMYRVLLVNALNIPGATNWLTKYLQEHNFISKPGFSNVLACLKKWQTPASQQVAPASQQVAPAFQQVAPAFQPVAPTIPAAKPAPQRMPGPAAKPAAYPAEPKAQQLPAAKPAAPQAAPSEAVLGMLITEIENNSNGFVDVLLSEGSSEENLELTRSEEIRPSTKKTLDMSLDISRGLAQLTVTSNSDETTFQVTRVGIDVTSKNRRPGKLNKETYQISKIVVDNTGKISLQPV